MIDERIVSFGPEKIYTGVLSFPPGWVDREITGKPGLLLINSGLTHHVGPYRFYVDLARTLADKGFPVLRFDLSGIGDSGRRKTSLADRERFVLDIQEALSFLEQKWGIKSFILLGHCMGAWSAHCTALVDSRVQGLILLEGYCFPTWKTRLERQLRFLSLRKWRIFLGEKWKTLKGKKKVKHLEQGFGWQFQTQNEIEKDLNAMIQKKIRFLFIFTDGNLLYRYPGQLQEGLKSVDFNQGIKEVHIAGADHSLTLKHSRKRVEQEILQWLN